MKTNMVSKCIVYLTGTIFLEIVLASCQKEEKLTITSPIVTTIEVQNITSTTATSGGNITNGGGATITASGVCWSTTTNPPITNSKTTDGTEIGEYISPIAGLAPLTTFYLRA